VVVSECHEALIKLFFSRPRMKAKGCQLVCVDGSHPTISLPHQEVVIIGRSPRTLIRDTRCSKKQGMFTFVVQ
jgi:hypothetical protein